MGNKNNKNSTNTLENNIQTLKNIEKVEHNMLNLWTSSDEERPYFFWLCNDNPNNIYDIGELAKWSPYEKSDTICLEYHYQKYLKGEHQDPVLGDYKINFEKMFQYHFKDAWRQRPIIRELPSRVKNIMRKSRFDSSIPNLKFSQPQIIEFKDHEAKTKIACIDDYVSVEFNIIPGKEIKFLILREFFKKANINLKGYKFESYLKSIKDEIENFSNEIKRFNFYKIFYITHVNDENFYYNIMKMYTAEGFLYKHINKILREKNLKEFEKMKFYYFALLASFEYSSRISNIKLKNIIDLKDKKFTLYRGQSLSQNEIEHYTEKDNSVRIFNEFLSTSLNEKVSREFALKGNCLIKLEVEYEEIEDKNYYTFLDSNLSDFPSEQEVLLKSGVIVLFSKLETEINTGLYILNGKVLSFGIKGFFRYLREKSSIKEIYLNNNDLGNNIEAVKSLANTLIIKDNIKELYLRNNKLGDNIIAVSYLTEALILNKSLILLDIRSNNLGLDLQNLILLSQVIKINESIRELILRGNYLGICAEGMEIFCEALAQNKTITTIDLSYNGFGENVASMEKLSYAMIENKSITKFIFSGNNFNDDDESFLFFCDLIENNKNINILDLRSNELSNHPKLCHNLLSALGKNQSIKEISLRSNNFGNNIEIIKDLSQFIAKNNSVENLDLSFNNLGSNSGVLKILDNSLITNTSIKEINLDSNNLGMKLSNVKSLCLILMQNNSIDSVYLHNNNLESKPEASNFINEVKMVKCNLKLFY